MSAAEIKHKMWIRGLKLLLIWEERRKRDRERNRNLNLKKIVQKDLLGTFLEDRQKEC